MKPKFLSTQQTVRANLTNDHVTVLITTNGIGEQVPPYILFPGESLSAIPCDILWRDDVWANFSSKGWMDVPCFQVWMLKYINEINRRKSNGNQADYSLLMVDGHNSCLDANTMFTAALNQIICLAGPSQLINAWQANDSGTNHKFKSVLSELIEDI